MQKNKPFFTIITCTLNSDRFLSKNIKSVRNQSFKNYEHVFVDGYSKDNTKKILKAYKNKFGSKVIIFNFLKRGVSRAFNKGIKEAKGEYIFFLNSDDYFYDNKVLQDVHLFLTSNKELDWMYGKINVVEEDGMAVGVFPLRKFFQIANRYLLKFINYVPHQSVFMKKSVFDKFGNFDPKLKLNMDTELFLRLSRDTNWIFFDRIMCAYVLRSDSLSSSYKNKNVGLEALEKVQERYLSKKEMFIAKIVNQLISSFNKIYR